MRMNELTEEDFADLCRDARISAQIAGVESDRSAAARTFWISVGAAVFAGLAIFAVSIRFGLPVIGIILAITVAVIGLVFGRQQLFRVGAAIKVPVLERLAAMTGATFARRDFAPPAYRDAGPILFGRISDSSFEDLFQATDAPGRRCAFYEARLKRGAGRSTTLLFTGQVYALQRPRRGGGGIAILPETALPDFFNAPKGMERVTFDSDTAFESAFQVYALRPSDAQSFLSQGLRRTLVELRRIGRVSVYVGPEDVFVGIVGKDRFEPGSLFAKMSGRDRVRIMFDDVRNAVATLNRLRAALG